MPLSQFVDLGLVENEPVETKGAKNRYGAVSEVDRKGSRVICNLS